MLWKNRKELKKWWDSIPVIPSLNNAQWQELLIKGNIIKELVDELNDVKIPKYWSGGWGFTGTSSFERGLADYDIPNIVEGLRWFHQELIKTPLNLVLIKKEKPEQFEQLMNEVVAFNKFLMKKGYWRDALGVTFRSKLLRFKQRGQKHLSIFGTMVWKNLKDSGKWLWKQFGLLVIVFFILVYVMPKLSRKLHFDCPSIGELLLGGCAIVGLVKVVNVVLISDSNTKQRK